MTKPRKSFTTKLGLEIPIMDLKGKEYVLAAERVRWWRSEHPNGVLESKMLALQGEGQDEYCIFEAKVYNENPNGGLPMLIAVAHKRESRKDFPDFIEKCQTSAYARALSLAGYGVQFSGDEMDEGVRLADAPLAPRPSKTETVEVAAITPAITTNGTRPASFRKSVTVAPAAVSKAGDDI